VFAAEEMGVGRFLLLLVAVVVVVVVMLMPVAEGMRGSAPPLVAVPVSIFLSLPVLGDPGV